MKKYRKKQLRSLLNYGDLKSLDLRGVNFSGLNLSKKNLSYLDLAGARFKKCCLQQVNFKGSVLRGACFSGASMEEAILRETDCSFADFSRANLCNVDFRQAKLEHASFYKANIKKINFSKAKLDRIDLSHLDLSDCTGKRSCFKEADLNSSCLRRVDFEAANFQGANLSNVKAEHAGFSASCLIRANLEGSVLNGTDFSRADLREANLSLSSLHGINVCGARLDKADFTFSVGISGEERKRLRECGAKKSALEEKIMRITQGILSSKWALMVSIIFIISSGVAVNLYFADAHRLSIPSLRFRYRVAKQDKKYQEALKLGLIMIKKLEGRGDQVNAFNKKLEAAKIYRITGAREKALTILRSLLQEYSNDLEKKARIHVEFGHLYMESGDLNQAISFLQGVRYLNLEKKILFSVEMSLARAYQKSGEHEKAMAIYTRLLETFKDSPGSISSIQKNIKTLKDMKKARIDRK